MVGAVRTCTKPVKLICIELYAANNAGLIIATPREAAGRQATSAHPMHPRMWLRRIAESWKDGARFVSHLDNEWEANTVYQMSEE